MLDRLRCFLAPSLDRYPAPKTMPPIAVDARLQPHVRASIGLVNGRDRTTGA
jgi:hypothetical protein